MLRLGLGVKGSNPGVGPMEVRATVHTHGGLSVPFLRVAGVDWIKDGTWCPLQLISGFHTAPPEPRVIRRQLGWEVRDGVDPYAQHCLFGLSRWCVAELMGYSNDQLDAIDKRQVVSLLSPIALSTLLSGMVRFKKQWAAPSWRFDSEEAFARLSAREPSSLGILVRLQCMHAVGFLVSGSGCIALCECGRSVATR